MTVSLVISSAAQAAPIAPKSELLALGSGHYAQVLLGPNEDIAPITFKSGVTVGIHSATDACHGTIHVSDSVSAASPYHVSGRPGVDQCSILFSVGTQEITVEFYRLPLVPDAAQWPSLLATLPKLIGTNAIYITSEVPTAELPFDAFGTIIDLDETAKAGTIKPLLKNAPDAVVRIDNQFEVSARDTKARRTPALASCKSDYSQRNGMTQPHLFVNFVPNVVGVNNTEVIEHCEWIFAGEALSLGADQPEPQSVLNLYIMKSYL